MSRKSVKRRGTALNGSSLYYNFREKNERCKTLSRGVNNLNKDLAEVATSIPSETNKEPTSESPRAKSIDLPRRTKSQHQGDAKHENQRQSAEVGIHSEPESLLPMGKAKSPSDTEHHMPSNSRDENVNSENVDEVRPQRRQRGAQKIKWILPNDTRSSKGKQKSPVSEDKGLREIGTDDRNSQTAKATGDLKVDDGVNAETEAFTGGKLPDIQVTQRSLKSEVIFVTERLHKDGSPAQHGAPSSGSAADSADNFGLQGNEYVHKTLGLKVITEDSDEADDISDMLEDRLQTEATGSDYSGGGGEPSNIPEVESKSEIEKEQVTLNSEFPMTQDEMRNMTYETFLAVSSEIKEFLIKVTQNRKAESCYFEKEANVLRYEVPSKSNMYWVSQKKNRQSNLRPIR